MEQTLIGREEEITVLPKALDSERAERIAVIGRRRVGKTFLINQIYGPNLIFQPTGARHASAQEQFRTFHAKLEKLAGAALPLPSDWLDAFAALRKCIEPQLSSHCTVWLSELLGNPQSHQ